MSKIEVRQTPRLLFTRADLRQRGIMSSNSSLLRWESVGRFPKRVRLGGHSVAWVASEIISHIENLRAERETSK